MVTRKVLNSVGCLFRTLQKSNAGLEKGRANILTRTRSFPSSPALLAVPATALLRSLTFFKLREQSDLKQARKMAEMQQLLENADRLWDEHKFDELLAFLKTHADTDHDDILWRLARVLGECCRLCDDKVVKKSLCFEAFDAAKRALAVNEKNAQAHMYYAILTDKTAEYEGITARISNAFVVKEHLMRACELDPKAAYTLYVLGMWCFLVADIPWYQRKIAELLFAAPPTSTYEEALGYFQKSAEANPKIPSSTNMILGKTHLRLGNTELAKSYLTTAYSAPVFTPDDMEAHKEAGELLVKLGVTLDEGDAV
ncbi:regulator of microtubule dynamics protein 1-like [Littorina saxatilis]|uniref:Regulator of microtubule dynamics protein 1 n=1 Tax=Littorina saxatilis TaxID=31220 RepID=A0AAN9C0M7_9CAEN